MIPCAARHAAGAGPSTLSNPRRLLAFPVHQAKLAIEATHGRLACARGIAAIGSGGEIVACDTMEAARRVAVLLAAHGSAAVAQAVGVTRLGGVLWNHVEKVEWRDGAARPWLPILHDGAIAKAARPEFQRYGDLLGATLRAEDRKWAAPVLKKYMDRLDRNWQRMSPEQVDAALREAELAIRGATLQPLRRAWSQATTVTVRDVAKSTRTILKERYLPRIQTTLTGTDLDAVRSIGTQGGWFLRDQMGRRSALLTTRGRGIVESGLRAGLGSDAIASNLQAGVPGLWSKWGKNYAQASATAAVNRGRTYSEVSGYQQAGVTYMEVQAVLDEATTQICRAMDGKIIAVDKAASLIARTNAVKKPEDIYTASPFLRVQVDRKSGVGQLRTTTGGVIATMERPGAGWDDRGKWAFHASNDQLHAMNVGPPPYHHRCRSWTVPRADMAQVPRGVDPVATSGLVTVPTKPPPGKPLPPPVVRPVDLLPRPRPGIPQLHGTNDAIDDLVVPEEAIDAAAPTHIVRGIREGKLGMTFQDWNPAGDKFVAPGRWRILPRRVQTIEDAYRAKALPESKVLSMQLAGGMGLQDIVTILDAQIAIWGPVPAAAGRLWSVAEHATGRTVLVRSSTILGGNRYLVEAVHRALAAKDQAKLVKILKQLQNKKVFDFSEPGLLDRLTLERPAGKAAPIKKPKNVKRVLPTTADPYRKTEGLLEGVPLREQLERRVADQEMDLYRFMNYEMRMEGLKEVTDVRWYGRKITKYIGTRIAGAGPVQIPKGMIARYSSAKGQASAKRYLRDNKVSVEKTHFATPKELQEIWEWALRPYPQRVRDLILSKKMPQVAWWNGPGQLDEAAAAYIEGEYLIMGYHKMNLTWAEDRAVLAHEMAHHIDYMIKQTEEAAWLYRNSRTTGGKLKAVKIKGKVAYYVMKGPWGDEYQGRKYGLINSKINVKPGHGEDYGGTYKEATEINSMGREFADSDLDLAKQYCKKTEVVSFMLSVLRGMFMPL